MERGSNSARFRAKLRLLSGSTDEAYGRFWAQPDLATHYKAYLIQLHQFVRASVPLMEAAQARAAAMADADPVCPPLAAYYEKHIDEERGHDLWILNDLEAAGVPRERVRRRVPSPRVASLVGAQYYWIAHHHPIALLSYIALFEEPPPLDSIADVQARSGLPDAAFGFLREHGAIDPTHGDDFDRLLDDLPLTPSHEETLGVSMAHCTSALEDCVRELSPAIHARG